MRFRKLDLNLLVALDALLTERNISRAAEKVHLSQSTLRTIAVGMPVTRHPPHRSVRARFGHTAPTSGG